MRLHLSCYAPACGRAVRLATGPGQGASLNKNNPHKFIQADGQDGAGQDPEDRAPGRRTDSVHRVQS
jgi:hypothetical protein